MKKDPAARFQTVQEMIERLDARDEGHFPVQCPVTFSKRITREMTRFVDLYPMAAAAMLFLSGLAILAGAGWGIWHLLSRG